MANTLVNNWPYLKRKKLMALREHSCRACGHRIIWEDTEDFLLDTCTSDLCDEPTPPELSYWVWSNDDSDFMPASAPARDYSCPPT